MPIPKVSRSRSSDSPSYWASTLVPRIRDWKERTFFRVEQETGYTHIDALFGEPGRNVINWRLIETHWKDLMRVLLSIREGRLSSVTLLRRLRYDSKGTASTG